jgi:ketosteroid isomerase-like protein
MMHAYDGLKLRFIPERIVISYDATLASDFGKVEFAHKEKGKRVMETAKYVVVWRKERGSWKVLYDSWNTNKPAKP